MTAAAAVPMFFKKDDDAPKKRRKRKVLRNTMRTIGDASSKVRERVTQELYKRNAELAMRNKTLALLRRLDEISLASEKVEEMAQQMVEAIASELEYEVVTIAIASKDNTTRRCIAISSNNEALAKKVVAVCSGVDQELPKETFETLESIRAGKQAYFDDLSKVYQKTLIDAIESTVKETDMALPNHSMMLPLRFGDNTLGVLTLSTSRSFKNASRYEHESLSGTVGLIALALYKAKLYTDLQRTSAELVAANVQLKNLDKAKSEFLSIASHQLYTPLTALRGYISMLREGDYGKVNDEQLPILDILDKSSSRLIELIKNLLDISRIESGRLELNIESVDLVDMARGLVEDLLPNAMEKRLRLEFHEPQGSVAHAAADAQRIRQVMLNFVDNAIKYTPQGNVDVYITQKGDAITFSVTDTGKGLETNDIDQLFHKFIRVGGAARFHTEGTGLGLYVAKQIIHEHHGEVFAYSEGIQKGSTFSMEMPIEGSKDSLKVGQKASVVIKAADAQGS